MTEVRIPLLMMELPVFQIYFGGSPMLREDLVIEKQRSRASSG